MFIGPTPSHTPSSRNPLYVEILRYVQSSNLFVADEQAKAERTSKKKREKNEKKKSSNPAVDIYGETYQSKQEL